MFWDVTQERWSAFVPTLFFGTLQPMLAVPAVHPGILDSGAQQQQMANTGNTAMLAEQPHSLSEEAFWVHSTHICCTDHC